MAEFLAAKTRGDGVSGGSVDDGEGVGSARVEKASVVVLFAHNFNPLHTNFWSDMEDRSRGSAPSTPGLRR